MRKLKLFFAACALCVGAVVANAANLPSSGSGEYFLKNVGTGKYLKGDAYYGTKVVTWNDPYAVTLTFVESGVYTMKSQQDRGNGNTYFTSGEDPFVDGASANMTFTEVDDVNHYFTINNGNGNLYATEVTEDGAALYKVMAGNVSTDYAKWQVISRAELVAALDAASSSNPVDATFFIKDAGIDVYSVNADSWTKTNVDLGGGGNAGHSAESWNKSSFNLSQTVTGLPNGKYRATCHGYYRWNSATGGNNNDAAIEAHTGGTEVLNAIFFAGSQETPLMSVAGDADATAFCLTMPQEGDGNWHNGPNSQWQAAACFTKGYYLNTIDNIVVTDGTLNIGVKKTTQAGTDWAVFDEFKLYYLGADLDALNESYTNALNEAMSFDQSTIKEIAVKEALANAINTYTCVDETEEALTAAVNALQAATSNASASVAAYASAKAYLDKMGAVLDGTNVYTQGSYDAKYGTWLSGYNEGTLTTADAASLNANVAYSTGWHSSNNIDDILLSTWTIGGEQAENYSKSLYINTWSVEGNTDGSEFHTPFFEYWVSSGSLAANTLVSTVAGLKANTTYSFTIRARVQGTTDKNANGIMMKVGDGTPVDISAGSRFNNGNFYIGNFSAVGETDAEGKLVTTITVAANSNISWLSFYNCKYTEGEDLSAYIADYEFALSTAQANNANTAYAAISGKEKADLVAAISDYASVDNTNKDALIAAKNALETASSAFVNAAYDYTTLADLSENVATKLAVAWPTVTSTTTAADINAKDIVVALVTAARAYTIDATSKLGNWSGAPNPNQAGESWDGTTTDKYYDSWNGETTMTQTVTLPAGDYALIFKCRASAAANVNVTDGTNTVRFTHKGSTGRGIATDGTATFADGETYANNGAGRGWEYRVLTFTSDGTTATTLTFNWNTKPEQWAGLDDIELRANPIDVTISENDGYTPTNSYANVTLNRTIKANTWNSFVVPFDIDNETLAAKFSNVEVAEYSETADGGNSIVSFDKMTTPAITANKPVLLKTSTAGTSYTFNGVLVKVGEAKAAGTNFDFVGTYDATTPITADDYFIASNKLYKSTGNTNIKGTRAYMKAKSANARITNIFFGDDATVIGGVKVAGDSGKIYNLNGQEVKSTRKGIFVQGGKKIVVK